MRCMDSVNLWRIQKLRKKNNEFKVLKYCILCGFGKVYKFKQTKRILHTLTGGSKFQSVPMTFENIPIP